MGDGGKGDKRVPGKGYGEGYDNISWDIDARREAKQDAGDRLNAQRDEVRMVCELMGLTEEQIQAVLDEEGL